MLLLIIDFYLKQIAIRKREIGDAKYSSFSGWTGNLLSIQLLYTVHFPHSYQKRFLDDIHDEKRLYLEMVLKLIGLEREIGRN